MSEGESTITIFMFIAVTLVVILVTSIFFAAFIDNITGNPLVDQPYFTKAKTFMQNYPTIIDFLIPLYFIAFTYINIVAARNQKVSDLQIVPKIIGAAVSLATVLVVGYMMQVIMEMSVFSSVVSSMVITSYFVSYIGIYAILHEFLVLIMLFGDALDD